MKRTTAQNSSGGLHIDKVAGVSAGTRDIAEDRNNLQEEICHAILHTGMALDGGDKYQLEKAIIALSKWPGEVFDLAIEVSPVTWASAQSDANPSNGRYFPAVKLWDANHDLGPLNYPLLVPVLLAQKAKAWSGSAYITDHTVSVSGSTLTGSGAAWDALVAAIAEDALKLGSYQRVVNVGGTDYAITAATPGSHTLTVSGSPAGGSQTAIVYPYRIIGSTSARVFKDSGNASMSPDGTRYINGLAIRDRMQGHYHDFQITGNNAAATSGSGYISHGTSQSGALTAANISGGDGIKGPITDTQNGNPRTGATTDPNATIRFRYMWAGIYK